MTQMNLQIIMLSEISQTRRIHTIGFHLSKILENALIYSDRADQWFPEDGDGKGKDGLQRHEETSMVGRHVHYVDCDDGFTSVIIRQNLSSHTL